MALISTKQNALKLQRYRERKEKESVCMSVCDGDSRHESAAHQLSSRFLQGRSQKLAGAAAPCEFLGAHKHTAMAIRDQLVFCMVSFYILL